MAQQAVVLRRRASTPPSPRRRCRQQWADKATNADGFEGFNRGARQVARYAAATPAVAQVLANTPTYMIFDDHEIADDWNLNGRWAARVYNREWGRFVVRNGLLAYALMQGWGNDPTHFTKDGEPGRKLLDAIPAAVKPGTAPTATVTADLDVLLGFDTPTTALPKRVRWNFSIKATDHSVVVLDTRTHRDVNDLSLEAPNLVTNLDEQLPEKAAIDTTTQLLVVISPVPVFGPSVIEQLGQPLAQLIIDLKNDHHVGEVPGFQPGDADDPSRAAGCGGRVERGGEKYDREGWSANEVGFEALLARLAGYPAVVLLSGDVHYGCTMALDYWAKDRERPTRIVQCTSSPAKNTFKAQIEEAVRQDGSLQRALEVPMERIAWKEIDADDLVPPGARLPLARRARLRRKPALVPSAVWPKGTTIPDGKQPDWRWRITSVVDTTTTRRGPAREDPSPGDRRDDRGQAGRRPVRRRGHPAPAARHRGQATPATGRVPAQLRHGPLRARRRHPRRRAPHPQRQRRRRVRCRRVASRCRPNVPRRRCWRSCPNTVHRAQLRTPNGAAAPILIAADG